MSDATVNAVPAVSPPVRATRMYVAPVGRNGSGPGTGAAPTEAPSLEPLPFDPAQQGRFAPDSPPPGWFPLGAVLDLQREDRSEFAEVWTGAPAALGTRGRSGSAATLRCTFAAWSKLAMALGSGSQQMNLLRTVQGAVPAGSGGTPDSAALMSGSTAAALRVRPDFPVTAGDLIAVDADYEGQTGFVGTPFATSFVSDPLQVNNDAHYLRRVSFNLQRVAQVVKSSTSQLLLLDGPLPAGGLDTMQAGTMQVSVVQGFQDRVGASFLSEWSALLVMDGVAGDRVLLHYPRLEVAPGATEAHSRMAAGLERLRPCASFVALPVVDPNDGERVLCFRSYLPAPGRAL